MSDSRRITLDEFERKVLDPDTPESELRQYVKVDEQASGAMRPRLTLDTTRVVPPENDEQRRGDGGEDALAEEVVADEDPGDDGAHHHVDEGDEGGADEGGRDAVRVPDGSGPLEEPGDRPGA